PGGSSRSLPLPCYKNWCWSDCHNCPEADIPIRRIRFFPGGTSREEVGFWQIAFALRRSPDFFWLAGLPAGAQGRFEGRLRFAGIPIVPVEFPWEQWACFESGAIR